MQNGRRLMRWFLGVSVVLFMVVAIFYKQFPVKKDETTVIDENMSMLFGYLLWKELERPDITYNVEEIIKGIRAAASGQPMPPGINEKNIWKLQYQLHEQKSHKNLQDGEAFLSKIAQKRDIKIVIPGKLYYEVLKEGSGPTIEPFSTSLFHYKITTLDGNSVADTYEEDVPKKICLANTIPGFTKGVEGMKAGEKRKLYIHPDLAYRKIGIVVPPQMLLLVDVEAISQEDCMKK